MQAMQGHSPGMKSLPANKLFDPESSPIATRKTKDESDDGMRQVFADGVYDISIISHTSIQTYTSSLLHSFPTHIELPSVFANTLLLSNAVRVSCFAMQRDL